MSVRTCIAVIVFVLAALGAGPLAAQLPPPSQTLSALHPGVPPARYFGQALASSGQYLAVGAPYYFGGAGGSSPGVVVIFQRSGSSWNFLHAVQAPVPANGDGFGASVHFFGSQLLVGAPYSTVSGVTARGVVHRYNLVAGSFVHAQTLNPGITLANGDWFGFHLSANNGWLAVGIPFGGNNEVGQVHLYRYEAGPDQWTYHSLLNGGQTGSRHGIRVLMSSERLFVGAPEESALGSSRGWVYENLRSGSGASATWGLAQRIRHNNGAVSVLGSALALSPSGRTLAVGAPFELNLNQTSQTGAVMIFNRASNGLWVQSARLDPPNPSVALNFGNSLSMNSDTDVLIGDVREGGATQWGGGHHYARDANNNWNRAASWQRGSGNASDFMGSDVLAINDQALIGASGIDNGASADEGRVFVYSNALLLFRDGWE